MWSTTQTVTSIVASNPTIPPKIAVKSLYPKKPTKKFRFKVLPGAHLLSEDDLQRAYQFGRFPYRPSTLFLQIFNSVISTTEENPLCGCVSPPLIGSSGVVVQTVLGSTLEILSHYRECILTAEREVILSAGFWKNGASVDAVHDMLVELNNNISQNPNRSKVVVKILWDRGYPRGGSFKFNAKVDQKKWPKLRVPSFHEVPNLKIEVLNNHRPVLGALHMKYLIVDRNKVLLSSNNIQNKPNLEICFCFEGEIVNSIYDTFLISWSESLCPSLPCLSTPASNTALFNFKSPEEIAANRSNNAFNPFFYHNSHPPVPMALLNRWPHGGFTNKDISTPQDVGWIGAFRYAKRSVYIQTPDFNATPAIIEIYEACVRGIQVTMLLCYGYNDLKEHIFQGGTNLQVTKRLYKQLEKAGFARNFTVGWYVAKQETHPVKNKLQSHVKFMAIDDEVAIVGSGNMDTQSWFHSAELNVMVDSPQIIQEWYTLFQRNQNTHLYGMVDHNSPVPPSVQVENILKVT